MSREHRITYVDKDAVEFGQHVHLWAARCSCGWLGPWYANGDNAEFSGHRHRSRQPALLNSDLTNEVLGDQ